MVRHGFATTATAAALVTTTASAADSGPGHLSPAQRNIAEPPSDEREATTSIRGSSIQERSVDPFVKHFGPLRKSDKWADSSPPRQDSALPRSASNAIFEMPGQMSDAQRADARRTCELTRTWPAGTDRDRSDRTLFERARPAGAP